MGSRRGAVWSARTARARSAFWASDFGNAEAAVAAGGGVAKTSEPGRDARQGRGLGGWGSVDGAQQQKAVSRHPERRHRPELGVYDLTLRAGRAQVGRACVEM